MKKIHPKNRLNKIHLVFDEEKRRQFLTGFRKRKLERKKQVQEKFEQELKSERRRIKAEAKERYRTFVVSHRDIPELKEVQEEYEDDNVKVAVVQLSAHNTVMENNYIGDNQTGNADSEKEEENDETASKNEIPGMELKVKKLLSTKPTLKASASDTKNIKKLLQKKATKRVQKSKIFQRKNKLEMQKQCRKNIKKKRELERLNKKKKKIFKNK